MAERTPGVHTSGSGSGPPENLNPVPPSSVASLSSMSAGDVNLLAPPSPSSMGLGKTTSFASSLSSLSSAHLRERLRVPVDAIQAQASRAHSAAATALRERVDFVPATVPRVRRLQTLAVAVWELSLSICLFIFLFLCSFPKLWPFLTLYIIWVRYIDKAPEHGGRTSQWFRSARFWRYFAEYYPASMKKEQDLPTDRPYVFGYHPHGIIGMGALATFATEATGFTQAYPGIRPHLLTLASNFRMPVYRDVLLALGICSVSRGSCANILKEGEGSAICIVVGGAAESLSAHPGTADLTLRKRLGFIKLAIQYGADLVPVFSFGENDIFEQMPNERGTMVYALQKKFQAAFGFTLPLFHGRGMLNYNLGLMPYRRRIVSVVGRPINVERCEKPTLDQIHAVQKLYIEELYRIWDTYKDVFAKQRKRELSIID